MAHRITLIPGGGTGPEIVEATRRVLEATGVEFDWDVQEGGVDVMEKYGTPLDDPTAVGTSQYADAIIEKLEASKVRA